MSKVTKIILDEKDKNKVAELLSLHGISYALLDTEKITVTIQGGCAYCDDPRVNIVDFDNSDEAAEIFELPAGTYYVGDLCYVLDDGEWQKTCDKMEGGGTIIKDVLDKPFFIGETAYGDGQFYDQFGRCYPVDSGTIGIVPIGCLDKKFLENKIHFMDTVHIKYCDGYFSFNEIEIDTRL